MLSPILLEYLTLSLIAFLLLIMIRVIFMKQRNRFRDRMSVRGISKSFFNDTQYLAVSGILILIPGMRWIWVTLNLILHISLRNDIFQDMVISYYMEKKQK